MLSAEIVHMLNQELTVICLTLDSRRKEVPHQIMEFQSSVPTRRLPPANVQVLYGLVSKINLIPEREFQPGRISDNGEQSIRLTQMLLYNAARENSVSTGKS